MFIDELFSASRRIAAGIDLLLTIEGLISCPGSTQFTITLAGCHASPCTLTLNIEGTVRQQFTRRLANELSMHVHTGHDPSGYYDA